MQWDGWRSQTLAGYHCYAFSQTGAVIEDHQRAPGVASPGYQKHLPAQFLPARRLEAVDDKEREQVAYFTFSEG
jgi:hypothetical protein